MGCAVGSRLVVHGGWDFPGSAALVCHSFVLRFAGGGLFPAQGWQHPCLLLPLCSAADKKLCLHPPERCNHPVLGLFHAPLPREGLQSQPGTLRTERVLERAGPRGA